MRDNDRSPLPTAEDARTERRPETDPRGRATGSRGRTDGRPEGREPRQDPGAPRARQHGALPPPVTRPAGSRARGRGGRGTLLRGGGRTNERTDERTNDRPRTARPTGKPGRPVGTSSAEAGAPGARGAPRAPRPGSRLRGTKARAATPPSRDRGGGAEGKPAARTDRTTDPRGEGRTDGRTAAPPPHTRAPRPASGGARGPARRPSCAARPPRTAAVGD